MRGSGSSDVLVEELTVPELQVVIPNPKLARMLLSRHAISLSLKNRLRDLCPGRSELGCRSST